MANPDTQTLPADTWTKVAQSITGGSIDIVTSTPTAYFRSYRVSGDAAPSGLANVKQLKDGEDISSISAIDVYIYPLGGIGKITVNL